ncbi:MAG: SDR family oxidoreductase [Deltaproteobacteria bacterium]|nr:SDR family oxidoreductase [Deltaproteobacteria bacterium]
MENAIVTGASSGIGLAISRKLVEMGFNVFGLARDFAKCDFDGGHFERVECDVTDWVAAAEVVARCVRAPGLLRVLVNNAGVGMFGPHETLDTNGIEEMVRVNLLAPMQLTAAALPALRQSRGYVINIASTAAFKPHRLGAAYAATKAGLVQFGRCLFDEVRKSGVRVTTVSPDMTATRFHDSAGFGPAEDPDCHLEPECVARAVESAITQREQTVLSEIIVVPQRVGIEHKKRT